MKFNPDLLSDGYEYYDGQGPYSGDMDFPAGDGPEEEVESIYNGEYEFYIPEEIRQEENALTVRVIMFSLVFCALFLLILWLALGKNHAVAPVQQITKEDSTSSRAMILPDFKEDVVIGSDVAKMVYDGSLSVVSAVSLGEAYAPFVFSYMLSADDGLLRISEAQDMSNAMEFPLTKEATSVSVDNLKTGTTYYYEVASGGAMESGSFRTAASTRYVNIPGAVNTRDIGGYLTQDGKMVKQGLLIRGTEIDGLAETGYFVETEDIPQVQQTFGFVYDFDLRADTVFAGPYRSPLGETVGHRFYNSPMYGAVFNVENQEILRTIFADLADPQKYPMYLHCTYGADRTGTIVFLLQGILNMSEEDMLREYHLTGFAGSSYADSNSMDVVVRGLSGYAGDTLQEKVVTFLTEQIGVTHQQIESIREILLEEP